MKKLSRVSVLGLSLLLGACSILPSAPKVDTYQLAPSNVSVQVKGLPLSLMVATPYANRYLSHQRLVVVQANHEVQAYAGVRWEDELPNVFRNRLIDDLRRAQAYRTVVNDKETVKTDRRLTTDILAYQVQMTEQQAMAVISVDANLFDNKNASVIASKRFSVNSSLNSTQLSDVMPTLGRLNDQINTQIIQWVVAQ